MAQRKRAGLITPKSLDRNGLPVVFILYYIILLIDNNRIYTFYYAMNKIRDSDATLHVH